MVWPAIIGAVGSVASGLIGSAGARQANAQQMKFNEVEASKNRLFQARMSRTAYQRGMNDMRLAGLNPILAGRLGGASSPAGSQANVGQLQNPQAGIAEGIAGATSAYMQNQQVAASTDQIKAVTANTKAQTDLIRNQTRIANREANRADTTAPLWKIASDYIERFEGPIREILEQIIQSNVPPGKRTREIVRQKINQTETNSAKKSNQIERADKAIDGLVETLRKQNQTAERYRNYDRVQRTIRDLIHDKPGGF